MQNLKQGNFFFFSDNFREAVFSPGSLEHGYLAILDNDLNTASEVFKRIDSPRGRWGYVLTSVLKGFMDKYPTYFQIRNFLEIDLDFLLKNEKIDYIEHLLGALEVFAPINQEVYKFTARVMYENRLYAAALKYMEKSKQIYYNDAELHFMFAKYYYRVHDNNEALFYINECLKLIHDYYPALTFKQKIEDTDF